MDCYGQIICNTNRNTYMGMMSIKFSIVVTSGEAGNIMGLERAKQKVSTVLVTFDRHIYTIDTMHKTDN